MKVPSLEQTISPGVMTNSAPPTAWLQKVGGFTALLLGIFYAAFLTLFLFMLQ